MYTSTIKMIKQLQENYHCVAFRKMAKQSDDPDSTLWLIECHDENKTETFVLKDFAADTLSSQDSMRRELTAYVLLGNTGLIPSPHVITETGVLMEYIRRPAKQTDILEAVNSVARLHSQMSARRADFERMIKNSYRHVFGEYEDYFFRVVPIVQDEIDELYSYRAKVNLVQLLPDFVEQLAPLQNLNTYVIQGDTWQGNMLGEEKPIIIDFECVMLGPLEFDLFFIFDRGFREQWKDFSSLQNLYASRSSLSYRLNLDTIYKGCLFECMRRLNYYAERDSNLFLYYYDLLRESALYLTGKELPKLTCR